MPEDSLAGYAVDGLTPRKAVLPAKAEDVSEVLSWASGAGMAVIPRGGGVHVGLANVPSRVDLVIGMERLDRLNFHEPLDMVAQVQAGMTLESLQTQLARHGQMLPIESPMAGKATIGGIVASDVTGPSRFAYGSPRDWLIGITVALADGTLTKAGGRVVKNVTGYDMGKLYVGSLGTLGVIVDATFKLAPLPTSSVALAAPSASVEEALSLAAGMLNLAGQPTSVHAVNRIAADRLDMPDLFPPHHGGFMLVGYSGRRSMVERAERDALGALPDGSSLLRGDESAGLWSRLTNLGWSNAVAPTLMLRAAIRPSRISSLLKTLSELPEGGLAVDAATGIARLYWFEDKGDDMNESLIYRVREAALESGGHLTVESCPLSIKGRVDVWGDLVTGQGLDLMRRIKRQLDPGSIMSPGRMAGRI